MTGKLTEIEIRRTNLLEVIRLRLSGDKLVRYIENKRRQALVRDGSAEGVQVVRKVG